MKNKPEVMKNPKPQTRYSFNLLVLFLLLAGLLFSSPSHKAKAFWGMGDVGTDPPAVAVQTTTAGTSAATAGSTWSILGINLKDQARLVYEQLKVTLATRALQEITKSTINWINSGYSGAPLFLENPQSFFEDVAKSEVKNMVEFYGYDPDRFPFGKQWSLNLIQSYKNTLADNTAYSLSRVTSDTNLIRNYQDFNYSGWDGFLINTQFPQNNYVGFQIEANNEMMRRIYGTAENKAQDVKKTLDQGMGFLSPMSCPEAINSEYDNGYNEFNRPRYNLSDYQKENPYDPPICDGSDSAHTPTAPSIPDCPAFIAYNQAYEAKQKTARAEWDKKYACIKPDGTSGLQRTTPGSVIANQVIKATQSPTTVKELAMASGRDILAYAFDNLLNKFIDKGLNSLASKINPQPKTEDNWNYNGQTLGVRGEGGTNIAWDSGPEVPIILDEFKKQINGKTTVNTTDVDGNPTTIEEVGNTGKGIYTPGDLANTEKELALIASLTNYYAQIWPEGRKLDVCIPGPDLGWEDRMQKEYERNTKKLDAIQGDSNEKKALEAETVQKEVKYAVDLFKDWINNKMLTELPNSVFFLEAVEGVKDLSLENNNLITKKKEKTQALARLNAIKIALDAFKEEPKQGSTEEKALISLKKQYDGINSMISNASSLSDRQTEVDVAKDKLEGLKKLTLQCESERKAKGWGIPGGATSSWSGAGTIIQNKNTKDVLKGLAPNSEQALFCSLPAIGGYSHEMMLNETGVTHPELPAINSKKLMTYDVMTIKSFLKSGNIFGGGFGNPYQKSYVNIQLSCNAIFNARLLDYKGDLPGLTTVVEISDPLPDDRGLEGVGTCTYDDGFVDADVTQESCELNNGSWEADNQN